MNKVVQRKYEYSTLLSSLYLLSQEDIQLAFNTFISKYVLVETSYKKLLLLYKNEKGTTKNNIKNLRIQLNEVFAVLEFFSLSYDERIIKRIFGPEDENLDTCSLRKLRDRVVHNITEKSLMAIFERKQEICDDLDYFLALLRE